MNGWAGGNDRGGVIVEVVIIQLGSCGVRDGGWRRQTVGSAAMGYDICQLRQGARSACCFGVSWSKKEFVVDAGYGGTVMAELAHVSLAHRRQEGSRSSLSWEICQDVHTRHRSAFALCQSIKAFCTMVYVESPKVSCLYWQASA